MIKQQYNLNNQHENGCEIYINQRIKMIEDYQNTGGSAYISIDKESALNTAKGIDLIRKAGFSTSPIAGLAINIKDMFDVKGEVTTAGSKVLAENEKAKIDAKVVHELRSSGAVLLGKGNMSEFAFSGLGWNPHYGTPVYADHFQRVAGGSTSGGAVAVALNHCVAALGSDTGGSLRIPAAFCGIVGFKPSSGRVSTEGAFPLSFSLDTVGAITNCVEDAIIMDEILSGQTHERTSFQPYQVRLAYTNDYFLENTDEHVHQTWLRTLELLKQQGITIEKVDISELYEIPQINAQGGLTAAEAWFIHRDNLNKVDLAEQYDQRVAQRIMRGKEIGVADYLLVQKKREELIQRVSCKLKEFDALIHPTVAIVPPLLSELDDEDNFFKINNLVLRNTSVINFINGCAINIPCHLEHTLPVGLSIAGLHGQDSKILNIAYLLESLLRNTVQEAD